MLQLFIFAKLSKKVAVRRASAPISDLRLLPLVTVPMGTESRSRSKVSGPLNVCCDAWGRQTRSRGPRPKTSSLSTALIGPPEDTSANQPILFRRGFLCLSLIGRLTAASEGILFKKRDYNLVFDYYL